MSAIVFCLGAGLLGIITAIRGRREEFPSHLGGLWASSAIVFIAGILFAAGELPIPTGTYCFP